MSAPRLWKLAVQCWQDPDREKRLDLKGVLILINPEPYKVEHGEAPDWCPDCVELALIEGGEWENAEAIPTESGCPARVSQVCDTCQYRGCEAHAEDHSDESTHGTHDFALESVGA